MRHIPMAGPLVLGLSLACSFPAHASNTQEELKAASLAATCANCHGTMGQGVEGAAVGGISRLTPKEIETAMQQYRAGDRSATVMHQIAKGYTDEQITLISRYLGKK